jgi:hypothetical protein
LTWFPVNDRPTDKASYETAVTAPTGLAAVSNGRLASNRVNTIFRRPPRIATINCRRYRMTGHWPVVNEWDLSIRLGLGRARYAGGKRSTT